MDTNSLFFQFIQPYLSILDSGKFFQKPISWLYTLLAALNLLLPFVILYIAVENKIFELPFKYGLAFILTWVGLLFACWVGFQIWWDRKSKVVQLVKENDEFVATPVVTHLIQTIGEWYGTMIAIMGTGISLIGGVLLGEESRMLGSLVKMDFLRGGFLFVFIWPVVGFVIIVAFRFLAETLRALSSIANNTNRKELYAEKIAADIPPVTPQSQANPDPLNLDVKQSLGF